VTLEQVLKLVELVSILYAVWRVSAQRAKIDAETAAAQRELASALKEFKSQSNEAHKEMWTAIDDNTHNIREHEKWIVRHDARKGIVEEDLK
jgi:hypothetical protein